MTIIASVDRYKAIASSEYADQHPDAPLVVLARKVDAAHPVWPAPPVVVWDDELRDYREATAS